MSSSFVPIFSLAPRSPPIRLPYNLRTLLAGELDLMRHREKTEPYYRGETPTRPAFLDHDIDSDPDNDSSSDFDAEMSDTTSERDSDDTMPSSEADHDGYIVGDAPVHATPFGRWSSGFLQDAGGFGLPNYADRHRSPSPRRPVHFEPLTHIYTRTELEHFGFESILDWSGPTPLSDSKGRVVGVLVDAPVERGDWERAIGQATRAIRQAAAKVDYSDLPEYGHQNTPHSLRTGIDYYGFGPTSVRPQNIVHKNSENMVEVAVLRNCQAFSEISSFQNTVHRAFSPRLFTHVEDTKQRLLNENWALRDNFVGGAFHASEWFLGADESAPRLDDLDMLWSWRALTALGRYQARWGGELILWEEKKIIKFPVGATILFPAAFTRYSFTQVRAGEAQYAFAQSCAAGPFRYVENGFRCEANFDTMAWKATRKAREAMKNRRMKTALEMYNFLDELDHLDEAEGDATQAGTGSS